MPDAFHLGLFAARLSCCQLAQRRAHACPHRRQTSVTVRGGHKEMEHKQEVGEVEEEVEEEVDMEVEMAYGNHLRDFELGSIPH